MDKNVCSHLNHRLMVVEEEVKTMRKENTWLRTKLLLQNEMIQRAYHYLPIEEEDYEDLWSDLEDGNGDNVDGASISEEENFIGLRVGENGKKFDSIVSNVCIGNVCVVSFFLKKQIFLCVLILFFLESSDDERVIVEERAIVNVDILFDSDLEEESDNGNNTIGKQNYSFSINF